jgi:hypothetical protein
VRPAPETLPSSHPPSVTDALQLRVAARQIRRGPFSSTKRSAITLRVLPSLSSSFGERSGHVSCRLVGGAQGCSSSLKLEEGRGDLRPCETAEGRRTIHA